MKADLNEQKMLVHDHMYLKLHANKPCQSLQFSVYNLILEKKNWNVNHYQYSEKYQIYIINRTLFLKIHDHKQYLHVKCVCYCWIPINILGLIKGKTTRFSFKKISMIFFSLRKQTPKLKFGTFRIKMNRSLIKR